MGRSDTILNLAMPPVHREMEYGLPRAEAAPMRRRVKKLIDRQALKVDFIVELRFVAADDLMLSGSFGRESCQFGVYMAQCDHLEAYFRGFEEMALEVGGRPHWGKEFSASKDALEKVLIRLNQKLNNSDISKAEGQNKFNKVIYVQYN